jgi:creatinine amidohydrolase/Fe(II)-dependent formamide hydrolase-like protein
VRKDLIADNPISFNREDSDFQWVDLFAAGPAMVTSWTSTYSKSRGMGAADLATKEKGKAAIDEAAMQLTRLVLEFGKRPRPKRVVHQLRKPSTKMAWQQLEV